MSKIWTIAQRELNAFFSTWMGYIIAFAALLINGLLFMSFAVGDEPKYSSQVLADFFYMSSGIGMVASLFLAMRLFAEEKQSGTIVLFFTSPITERQMVYGKFLSSFLFFLFLCALSFYLPLLLKLQGKISYGQVAAGYLGVIGVSAAVMSLSLFASVIAPNQLLAGILGAVFTVIALVLWLMMKVVDSPFRELFGYLAIHNQHFNPFMRGIVHTKDLVFYASVVFFFLECSVRTLEMRRWQG